MGEADIKVVEEKILSLVSSLRVRIYSDGDWDGILASAILLRWLRSRVRSVDLDWVYFPQPGRISGMKVEDAIIIELPPSRGYEVAGTCILFDHHAFTGVMELSKGGLSRKLLVLDKHFPSVSRLVADVLKAWTLIEDLREIVDAVDLIDEGRSMADEKAWLMHRAYLARKDDPGYRRRLLELLYNGEKDELMRLIEEDARKYDEARKRVFPKMLERCVTAGGVAFTWYLLSSTEERMVFREVMMRLEEDNPVVVVAGVREDGTMDRLHLASRKINVGDYVEKVLRFLREKGVTGGGKRSAGGIQFPLLVLRLEDKEKILEMFRNLYGEADTCL